MKQFVQRVTAVVGARAFTVYVTVFLVDQFTSRYYNTVSLSSDRHPQTKNYFAPAHLRFSIVRFIIINIIILAYSAIFLSAAVSAVAP